MPSIVCYDDNGEYHSAGGPAIIMSNGTRLWYLHVDSHGNKSWWLNGKLHREDGPALEHNDGAKIWYLNGERHRIGGPAYESDYLNTWWIDGKLHREDGPAVEYIGGTVEWWLNDKEYSKEEWFKQLTPEQQYDYLWRVDE
jgi:hypothetical protein